MIYLHKLLPILASPLMILFYIMVLSIFTKSKRETIFATVFLLVISNPFIGNLAIKYLEKQYPPIVLADVPIVDAVVVLGGIVKTIQGPNNSLKYEFGEAVDRINAGIELIHLGKAKTLILTRGRLPWSLGVPEGEFLKEVSIKRGINPSAIQLTKEVQNTDQEAAAISKIISEEQKIALVTSAFHMPRAMKVFEHNNLQVIPVPVDHILGTQKFQITELLPNVGAIQKISLLSRELIGRIYYYFKY